MQFPYFRKPPPPTSLSSLLGLIGTVLSHRIKELPNSNVFLVPDYAIPHIKRFLVVVPERTTISSEVGGENRSGAEAPTGNPSPAPSTRTARIARTTRQINGANHLVAKPKLGGLDFAPSRTKIRPEAMARQWEKTFHFNKENKRFLGEHGENMESQSSSPLIKILVL